MMHFRYSPLDNIAKMSVVDIIVLLSDCSLGSFFQFILPVSNGVQFSYALDRRRMKTYTLTKESFDNTAITLFSSFGCKPILLAKSSSLRLRVWKEPRMKRWF